MDHFPVKNFVLGTIGGIAGGIAGGFICKFLSGQGFYGGMIPGAMVGLGFAFAARYGHLLFSVASGILGLVAGLVTEWLVFHSDMSFFESLVQLKQEGIVTWVMLGIGTLLAFSLGNGNRYNVSQRKTNTDDQT